MHHSARPLRVVIADPPRREEPYPYHLPTMGVLYLLGAIKRAFPPSEVSVTYLGANETLDTHLKRIADLKPDLYGLSFKSQMARIAYRTLNAVKQRFPQLPVIAGGQHVSALPHEIMERTSVNAAFRGECEETIVTLIESFNGLSTKYSHIAGAVFRESGEVISNPVAPLKARIDDIPWPAWDVITPTDFPGMPYKRGYPYLGVLVSRGCPFQCTFCSEPVWKIHGRPSFRARSPEDIAREVEHVYRMGVKEMRLLCEEFNVSEKWCCEVLDRIIALGHKDLFLNFNIRGDVMSDRLATAMKAANVWMVNIGIESVSDRTLRGVKKRVTVAQIEETCRILVNHDIKLMGYFQFFLAWEENGVLCWETAEDARRTIKWALDLHGKGLIHYMATAVASPRPATPLFDLAVKHNLFNSPPDDPFPYLTEGLRLPGLTRYSVARTMLWADYAKLRVALASGDLNWPLARETAARHFKRAAGRVRGKAAA
jgi:anaerobic magnesium-protoporphyrin IX monomethyl ester cyclase